MAKTQTGSVLVPLIIVLSLACLSAALLTSGVTQLLQLMSGSQHLQSAWAQYFRLAGSKPAPAPGSILVGQQHPAAGPILLSQIYYESGPLRAWQQRITVPILAALPSQARQVLTAAASEDFAFLLEPLLTSMQPPLSKALLQRPASHDCQELSAATAGLVILHNDCELAAGRQLGSATAPVWVISINNRVTLAGNNHVYGLWTHISQLPANTLYSASASNRLYGAVLTTAPATLPLSQIDYRPDILEQLQGLESLQSHHNVAGSWRDFE